MWFDKVVVIIAVGVMSLAAAACGGESGDGTGGGATTTSTNTGNPNGPSGSGWGAVQQNGMCADPPLFTPGTKQDGETCGDTGECAPACCPCPTGGSYWSYSCQKGLCIGDGNCSATVGEACK